VLCHESSSPVRRARECRIDRLGTVPVVARTGNLATFSVRLACQRLSMTRDQANAALERATEEVDELRASGYFTREHKKGYAPLAAIYAASNDVLERWVYADGPEGRALQGRDEIERRDAARLLKVAIVTLLVSSVAIVVSIVIALTS
jgi:hypothetical protein